MHPTLIRDLVPGDQFLVAERKDLKYNTNDYMLELTNEWLTVSMVDSDYSSYLNEQDEHATITAYYTDSHIDRGSCWSYYHMNVPATNRYLMKKYHKNTLEGPELPSI